jgi:hypothetical protein
MGKYLGERLLKVIKIKNRVKIFTANTQITQWVAQKNC